MHAPANMSDSFQTKTEWTWAWQACLALIVDEKRNKKLISYIDGIKLCYICIQHIYTTEQSQKCGWIGCFSQKIIFK